MHSTHFLAFGSNLAKLDVSMNQLQCTLQQFFAPFSTADSNIISLKASHNQLSGTLDTIPFTYLKMLEELDLTHNGITGPLWQSPEMISSLERIALSHNQITGVIPAYFSFYGLSFLSLDGNQMASNQQFPLAGYVTQTNASFNAFMGISMECPSLATSTGVVQLDPSYYGYANCRCAFGTYGAPPSCNACPTGASTYCNEGPEFTCITGLYKQPNGCASCPEGATCDGSSHVQSQKDYWLETLPNGTVEAYRCPSGYCDAENHCAANRNESSVLCGACNTGFDEWSGICVECNNQSSLLFLGVFFWNWVFVIVIHFLSQVSRLNDFNEILRNVLGIRIS